MACGDNNKNKLYADDQTTKKQELEAKEVEIEKARKIQQDQIKNLVKNRQAAINPYAGITNESANLGVATKAAEFQAEQSDIALANTLDAMRSSGAGAGGATALAQAALQSKKGIAASLQTQEAANQKQAAQGAQNIAKMKADGEKIKFDTTETRQNAEINRQSALLDQYNQQVESNFDAYTQADLAGQG
tara:strand:+ start:84 stop:653 length:570 start_codon:yes stop_codon:yes gene_type:complete